MLKCYIDMYIKTKSISFPQVTKTSYSNRIANVPNPKVEETPKSSDIGAPIFNFPIPILLIF